MSSNDRYTAEEMPFRIVLAMGTSGGGI